MTTTSAHDVLTVVSTARPKRIAVLVDVDSTTGDELDAITEQAVTCWGGGFWPIVPCDGSVITDDWWSLLEAVDPDVVFSACGLDSRLYDEIHRRLGPARLGDVGTVSEA